MGGIGEWERVDIPVHASKIDGPTGDNMMARAPHTAHIIVIDDNPGDVELLGWALSQAGVEFELSVIADGGEALELVRRAGLTEETNAPDLVILDLNLPKVDGKEILRAMRSSEGFGSVPVIVWTSSNAVRDRAQLNELRVQQYLVKPPELDDFLSLGLAIKRVLDERGASSREPQDEETH